jgi:hypothetical protein
LNPFNFVSFITLTPTGESDPGGSASKSRATPDEVAEAEGPTATEASVSITTEEDLNGSAESVVAATEISSVSAISDGDGTNQKSSKTPARWFSPFLLTWAVVGRHTNQPASFLQIAESHTPVPKLSAPAVSVASAESVRSPAASTSETSSTPHGLHGDKGATAAALHKQAMEMNVTAKVIATTLAQNSKRRAQDELVSDIETELERPNLTAQARESLEEELRQVKKQRRELLKKQAEFS